MGNLQKAEALRHKEEEAEEQRKAIADLQGLLARLTMGQVSLLAEGTSKVRNNNGNIQCCMDRMEVCLPLVYYHTIQFSTLHLTPPLPSLLRLTPPGPESCPRWP